MKQPVDLWKGRANDNVQSTLHGHIREYLIDGSSFMVWLIFCKNGDYGQNANHLTHT